MSRHTIEEARAVMAETARLLAKTPAKKPPTVAASAKATAKPGDARPSPVAATRMDFMTHVEAKVRAGLPRAKAVRAVAVERPDLHAEFLTAYNAQAREAQALKRKAAGLERDLRESRAAR